MIGRIKEDHDITIRYVKVWRAKDITLKKINSDEVKEYEKLNEYKNELLRTNLGSTIQLGKDKRCIYVCQY